MMLKGVMLAVALAVPSPTPANDEGPTCCALLQAVQAIHDARISIVNAVASNAATLSASFDAIDVDASGGISFAEMQTVMAGKATDAELQAIFNEIDLNGDGTITKLESLLAADGASRAVIVNAIRNGGPQATSAYLAKHFNTLDTSLDGLLDFNEMQTALGGLATDAQLQAIFNELDLNGNGTISKLESLIASEGTSRSVLVNAIRNGGPQAVNAYLQKHFKTLDTSVDGLLDFDEMKNALHGMASDAQLAAMFKTLDTDNSGAISELELISGRTLDTKTNTGDTATNVGTVTTTLTDAQDGAFTGLKNKVKDVTAAVNDQRSSLKWLPVISQRLFEVAKFIGMDKAVDKDPRTGEDQRLYASSDQDLGFAHGGIVGAYAPGGIVGNGVWNRDSVRARFAGGGDILLAGGEGVLNAQAMRTIGPTAFDVMNSTGRIPGGGDNGRHFARLGEGVHNDFSTQNRVLIAGFSAMVRSNQEGFAELSRRLDNLKHRERLEASREPRNKKKAA